MNLALRRALYLLALAGCLTGCGRHQNAPNVTATPEAPPAPTPQVQAPAGWARDDPSRWPQLVLTNEADFKGHTSLEGASAFLINTPGGDIMAATAFHLLGRNGGVEPSIKRSELDQALSSWVLFPRTRDDLSLPVAGLGAPPVKIQSYDWLVLKIGRHSGELPSTPLTLRAKPAEVGEDVFLVGVPYSEPDRAQNVYRGRVTLRERDDRFRFSIDPPVNIVGFSGCPILDKDGLVIGVFSLGFEPKERDGRHLEGGAEDAASVLKSLQSQS